MSEHYPESAIGERIPAWCGKCGRMTLHVIVRHSEHAGKLGHCTEHAYPFMTKAQQKRARDDARRRQNPELPFA